MKIARQAVNYQVKDTGARRGGGGAGEHARVVLEKILKQEGIKSERSRKKGKEGTLALGMVVN